MQTDVSSRLLHIHASFPRLHTRHRSRCHRTCTAVSRRELELQSLVSLVFADIDLSSLDATTLLNSVLGAYGLPKLKAGLGFRSYEDLDLGISFEYPKHWIKRANHLRPGLYVSDYNTSDKAVVEIFATEDPDAVATELVRRFVSPGLEIGGDARLIMPSDRDIKSESANIDGQSYTFVRFPSETVTRSGYQIRRKNVGVAAVKKGRVHSLVASARTDEYNKDKATLLQHIVDSFRVQS